MAAARTNIYESLPAIYDHLMRKIRYDYWADYLFRVTSKYISKDAGVLELAAGNCRLADHFIKKYPKLIVSDISRQMLSGSENKKIKKVCCDMLSIPFKKKFELIYAAFDSVNYLLTKKKISEFLKGIRSLISNEGIFTFDVSLEKNSISHIRQPVRRGKYKGIAYLHKSIYDERARIHKNIFDIELPDGQKFKEIHKQKVLDFNEYFALIEAANFFVAECFEAFTFNDGKPDSKRVQFVLKKYKE